MISDEYAAGFFDGEGSVYAATRGPARAKPSLTVLVCISNTNRDVLQLHQERWGGSLLARKMKPGLNLRQQYQWVIPSKKAEEFLEAVAPYLIIKREVVAVALALIRLMGAPAKDRLDYVSAVRVDGRYRPAPRMKPEYAAKVTDLHSQIRELNKRGAPWNARRTYDA